MHETMHFLAQGAINVTEGTDANPYPSHEEKPHPRGCFVQQGSRVHQALESICALLPPGEASIEIKSARIVERYTGHFRPPAVTEKRVSFWVMHPSNDAILAICKTRTDAEAVVKCFDTLADHFRAPQ